MKIKKAIPKRLQAPPDDVQHHIERVIKAGESELPECLRVFEGWPFPRGDFYHWIGVLDKFDEILGRAAGVERLAGKRKDRGVLVAVLGFTRLLFEHCVNRSVYSSYEHLDALLKVNDLEVVEAVLQVLMKPAHRIANQRSVKMQFNVSTETLQILAGCWTSRERNVIGVGELSEMHVIKGSGIKFQFYKSKVEGGEGEEEDNGGLVTLDYEDVYVFGKTVTLIYNNMVNAFDVPVENQFQLLQKIRMLVGLNNLSMRKNLLMIKLMSLTILGYVVTEEIANNSIFLYEPNIIKELPDLLDPERKVNWELRTAAVHALDGLGRYKNRFQEVLSGLNVSANHGVITFIFKKMQNCMEEGKELDFPHEFIEGLFSLISYLVTNNAGGNALISSGTVQTFVRFLQNKNEKFLKLNTKCLIVLDNLIYGFPTAFNIFCGAEGIVELVKRIEYEIEEVVKMREQEGNQPNERMQMIKASLKIMLHMMQTNGTAEGMRNLIDSSLPKSVNLIFKNSKVFESNIYSLGVDIFATFIHNEPTMLNVLQELKIPQSLLDTVEEGIMNSVEVLNSLPHAFSAICLNNNGLNMLIERKPMKHFLKIFTRREYLNSLGERVDMPVILGNAIDELIRHQPSLKQGIFESILEMLDDIERANEELIATSEEKNMNYCRLRERRKEDSEQVKFDYNFESEKREVLAASIMTQYIENISKFLEGIFQHHPHCNYFIEIGGMNKLMKMYSQSTLPYDFASSSSSYALSHLIRLIGEIEPNIIAPCVFNELIPWLNKCDFIINYNKRESLFERYVDLRDEDIIKEAQEHFRIMITVHGLIGLLSDLYCSQSIVFTRVSSQIIKGLSEDDRIKGLSLISKLHRACVWEYNVYRRVIPKQWLTMKKEKEEMVANPFDYRVKNARQLKFLLTQIPSCVIPLFAGIGRLLFNKKNENFEDSFKVANVLTGSLIENLKYTRVESKIIEPLQVAVASPKEVDLVRINYLHIILGQCKVLCFDDSSYKIQLQPFPAFTFIKQNGNETMEEIFKYLNGLNFNEFELNEIELVWKSLFQLFENFMDNEVLNNSHYEELKVDFNEYLSKLSETSLKCLSMFDPCLYSSVILKQYFKVVYNYEKVSEKYKERVRVKRDKERESKEVESGNVSGRDITSIETTLDGHAQFKMDLIKKCLKLTDKDILFEISDLIKKSEFPKELLLKDVEFKDFGRIRLIAMLIEKFDKNELMKFVLDLKVDLDYPISMASFLLICENILIQREIDEMKVGEMKEKMEGEMKGEKSDVNVESHTLQSNSQQNNSQQIVEKVLSVVNRIFEIDELKDEGLEDLINSTVRILVLITRRNLLDLKIVSKLLKFVSLSVKKEHQGLHSLVSIIIRHFYEQNKLKELMNEEINVKWNTKGSKMELKLFCNNLDVVALRDKNEFIKAIGDSCLLTNVNDSIFIQKKDKGDEKGVEQGVEAVKVVEEKVSSKDDNVFSKDEEEESVKIDPLVYILFEELNKLILQDSVEVKDGVVGEKELVEEVVGEKVVSEQLKEVVGEQVQREESDKGNNSTSTSALVERTFRICYLIQLITEFVACFDNVGKQLISYCKRDSKNRFGFISLMLKYLNYEQDENKSENKSESQKNENLENKHKSLISNWVGYLLFVLSINNGKFVIDSISKSIKEIILSNELIDNKYKKLYCLGELVNKMLSSKYPISKNNLKFQLKEKEIGNNLPFNNATLSSTDVSLNLAKLLIDKNFVNILTFALNEIDIFHPQSKNVINSLLKALETISRLSTTIKQSFKEEESEQESFSDEEEYLNDLMNESSNDESDSSNVEMGEFEDLTEDDISNDSEDEQSDYSDEDMEIVVRPPHEHGLSDIEDHDDDDDDEMDQMDQMDEMEQFNDELNQDDIEEEIEDEEMDDADQDHHEIVLEIEHEEEEDEDEDEDDESESEDDQEILFEEEEDLVDVFRLNRPRIDAFDLIYNEPHPQLFQSPDQMSHPQAPIIPVHPHLSRPSDNATNPHNQHRLTTESLIGGHAIQLLEQMMNRNQRDHVWHIDRNTNRLVDRSVKDDLFTCVRQLNLLNTQKRWWLEGKLIFNHPANYVDCIVREIKERLVIEEKKVEQGVERVEEGVERVEEGEEGIESESEDEEMDHDDESESEESDVSDEEMADERVEATVEPIVESGNSTTGVPTTTIPMTTDTANANPVEPPASDEFQDPGIDIAFLEAIPEDMQRDVIVQYVEERYRNAPNHQPPRLSDVFMNSLTERLRNLVQEQERIVQSQYNPTIETGPLDIDAATFFASLDPELRAQILFEQDDSLISSLPATIVAEARAVREPIRTFRNVLMSSTRKPTPIKETPNIIDKNGISILTRLLFLPDNSNKRIMFKLLTNLCGNLKTSEEVLNTLLMFLSDNEFEKNKKNLLKSPFATPSRRKIMKSFQVLIEETPMLIPMRCLEVFLHLINNNSKIVFYFIKESENEKKKKKSKIPLVPLVSVFGLLGRDLFVGNAVVLEPLLQVICVVLEKIRMKNKKVEQSENERGEGERGESGRVEGGEGDNVGASTSTATGASTSTAIATANTNVRASTSTAIATANTNVRASTSTATATANTNVGASTSTAIATANTNVRASTSTAIATANTNVGASTSTAVPNDNVPSTSTAASTSSLLDDISLGDGCFRAFIKCILDGQFTMKSLQYLIKIANNLNNISGRQILIKEIKKSIKFMIKGILEDLNKINEKFFYEFSRLDSKQNKFYRLIKVLDQFKKEEIKFENQGIKVIWKKTSEILKNISMEESIVLLPLIESFFIISKHEKSLSLMLNEFTEEQRKLLNEMIRNNPTLLTEAFSIMISNPKNIDFDNKRSYFKQELKKKDENRNNNYSGTFPITVHRQYVFEESFHQVMSRSSEELKYGKLNVRFYNEDGVDAGGVTRDWFSTLSIQMFNPDYALFKTSAVDKITYQPNRSSWVNPEHLLYFKFCGRIIGKAIYDGKLLDCFFTRSFYKQILGLQIDYKDMEAIDPEYFKSLVWILENNITDILDLTFSIESDDFGKRRIVDLITNGRNIPVTEQNKVDYVKLVSEHRLLNAIKSQVDAFKQGFYEIIPQNLISIFNEQELELLISGLPDIDIDDWRNNTEYQGYNISSPQIQWFWRAVRSFTQEERAKLIQFVTGTSKVPLEGFSKLQGSSGVQRFQIHKAYGNDASTVRLPSAHTCFNQLDLPPYESYEQTRELLLLAINECAGFGFS